MSQVAPEAKIKSGQIKSSRGMNQGMNNISAFPIEACRFNVSLKRVNALLLWSLTVFSVSPLAEEAVTADSVIKLAEQKAVLRKYEQAKSVYWALLESSAIRNDTDLIESACLSLAKFIPRSEISAYSKSIWHCDHALLESWLGNLEIYITLPPIRTFGILPELPEIEEFSGTIKVVVLFDVTKKGTVKNIRLKASDDARFNSASLEAAGRLRYAPGYLYGKTADFTDQEITFSYHW